MTTFVFEAFDIDDQIYAAAQRDLEELVRWDEAHANDPDLPVLDWALKDLL